MTKKFLIVLSNHEDVEIILAEPGAEQWINTEPTEVNVKEQIPEALFADAAEGDDEQKEVYVSSGSWDNDRALACPGRHYSSFLEVTRVIHDADIELTGEYLGAIY